MVHSTLRYALIAPIYTLMPDHLHFIWMGLHPGSDQLNAIKRFRESLNNALQPVGCELQDQPYDHMLEGEKRLETGFCAVFEYIARNPERAGLILAGSLR